MSRKAKGVLESLPGLVMLGIVGLSVGTTQDLNGADPAGLHEEVINSLRIEVSTRNLAFDVIEAAGPELKEGLRIATEAALNGEFCLNGTRVSQKGDANTDF